MPNDTSVIEEQRAIKYLENSIMELQRLFIDSNQLLREQDDQVTEIADQVDRGVVDLSQANVSLTEAIKIRIWTRRKTMIIALLFLLTAVGIGFTIWLAVRPR
jgi:t-SNARE complex subunit (syntaxin)